jgi:hypothetical protein
MITTISTRLSAALLAIFGAFAFTMWLAERAFAMTAPTNDGSDTVTTSAGASGQGAAIWTYVVTAAIAAAIAIVLVEATHRWMSHRRVLTAS